MRVSYKPLMPATLRRPIFAALAVVGAFASCSFASVNEAGVRAQGADHLDCEEQLLKLENVAGPGSGVARYHVNGCGRTTTLDCIENKSGVLCRSVGGGHGDSAGSDGSGVGEAVAGAATGCACGSLFGRSKDNEESSTSGSPTPMSTTPQRTKR